MEIITHWSTFSNMVPLRSEAYPKLNVIRLNDLKKAMHTRIGQSDKKTLRFYNYL